MKSIPFYQYPPSFWNSCYDILDEETKCIAEEGDLCFLCDGYLFLVQDPFHKANLILQSIAPSIHPVPPIKYVYKLVLILHSLGVYYLHFSGRGTRYELIYTRLFTALLNDGVPDLLRVYNEDDYTGYVLHTTPLVVEYATEQLKDYDFYSIIFEN